MSFPTVKEICRILELTRPSVQPHICLDGEFGYDV